MAIRQFTRVETEGGKPLTLTRILKENVDASHPARVIVDIVRQDTAKGCCDVFFTTINSLRGTATDEEKKAQLPDAVRIAAVGLRLGGRSGTYDMFWFSMNDRIFAVDVKNDTMCYEMLAAT